MSKANRSVVLYSLFPAFLLAGVFAVQAQNAGSVKPTNWSDPATWPNKKVPAAGDKVTIGRDKDVVLDVSPPHSAACPSTASSPSPTTPTWS
jgi:hypothetical protein